MVVSGDKQSGGGEEEDTSLPLDELPFPTRNGGTKATAGSLRESTTESTTDVTVNSDSEHQDQVGNAGGHYTSTNRMKAEKHVAQPPEKKVEDKKPKSPNGRGRITRLNTSPTRHKFAVTRLINTSPTRHKVAANHKKCPPRCKSEGHKLRSAESEPDLKQDQDLMEIIAERSRGAAQKLSKDASEKTGSNIPAKRLHQDQTKNVGENHEDKKPKNPTARGRITRLITSPTSHKFAAYHKQSLPRCKSEGHGLRSAESEPDFMQDQDLMEIITERSRGAAHKLSNDASEQADSSISTKQLHPHQHKNMMENHGPSRTVNRCTISPVKQKRFGANQKRSPLRGKSEGAKSSVEELEAGHDSPMDEELAKIIAERSRDVAQGAGEIPPDSGRSRDLLQSLKTEPVDHGGTLEGKNLLSEESISIISDHLQPLPAPDDEEEYYNYSRDSKRRVDGPVQPGAHGVAPGVRPTRNQSVRYSVAMNNHVEFAPAPQEDFNGIGRDTVNSNNPHSGQALEIENDVPQLELAPPDLSRLVSARVVDPESEIWDVESRSVASEYTLPPVETIRKRYVFLGASLVSFFILLSGLVLLVLYFMGVLTPEASVEITPVPTSSPTMVPFPIPLLNQTVQAIRNDPDSPQSKAYAWLQNDTLFKAYSEVHLLQRFVLVTFFYSTNGDSWILNKDWRSHDLDVCDWHTKWIGVEGNFSGICDENGLYRRLLLTNNGLSGSLPPELGLLSNLLVLDVASNDIAGTIPSEIGLLTSLTELAVDVNRLSGQVPTEVGQLTNLETLFVHTNPLTGSTIPTQIGLLKNLGNLQWAKSKTAGRLPTQLGLLSKTTKLYFSYNEITGTIPSEVGTLQNINKLFLYGNKLEGSIPSQIGELLKLEKLNFYGNELTGLIPSQLGNCKSLLSIDFEINHLSSSIPLEVFQNLNLTKLWLSSNDLHGALPSEIGNLSYLEKLRLDINRFSGSIPTEAGQLSNLLELWLSNTNINGALPSQMGNMLSLTDLRLSNTEINGQIPEAFVHVLGNLETLQLHNTSLSGTLPAESCDVPQLDFNCSDMLCGCSCICQNAGQGGQQ